MKILCPIFICSVFFLEGKQGSFAVISSSPTWFSCKLLHLGLRNRSMQILRGGISKYYNHSAPSNRGGFFEEPKSGVSNDEGQSVWNKGGWSFEEVVVTRDATNSTSLICLYYCCIPQNLPKSVRLQRDYTQFCKSRMEVLLSEIKSPIRLYNISGLKGHALVTYRL